MEKEEAGSMDQAHEAQDISLPHTTKTIMLTSSKGGVGKTTVCANLAVSLVKEGCRVLTVDLDFDNRCLDLLLHMEDDVMYNLGDVLRGDITPQRAILDCARLPGLSFLPAPPAGVFSFDTQILTNMLHQLATDGTYDYILLDTPGAAGQALLCAAKAADEALILSSAQTTAIRGAEHTGGVLATHGVQTQYLVVNQYIPQKKKKNRVQDQLTLIDMIDTISIPLLGVIPFFPRLWSDQNQGILMDHITYRGTGFACAMQNIAKRLQGIQVPLMQGV